MATPPASPSLSGPGQGGTHSGPAWTRNVQKPSPRVAALGGGAASSSSLSLPASVARTPGHQGGGGGGGANTDEAPYLTHVHRHHGQLTLVAPDNLGARRQPGTVDPPHLRHDAGGGWGVIDLDDPDLPTPEEAAAALNPSSGGAGIILGSGKKQKLKKGTKKKREKEQKEKRERAIASAVANAGKSPIGVSPLPSPTPPTEFPPPGTPRNTLAPPPASDSTTPRASPGLSSTVPAGSRPGMTPRSTSGTSSSLQQSSTTAASVAAASRRARRARAGAGTEDQTTTAGSSSRTSGSSALGPDRRPLEGPRPQPAPLGTPSPGLSESARGTVSVPLSGTNIPAYLSTTAPTPPLPPNRGGPLQQSRAVARARAARNAHAAVMQAGIQARAQEALRHLQELNHQPEPASTTGAAAVARQAGASPVPGDAIPATSISTSSSPGGAATTAGSQNATGASTSATRQRPRMRHRPSEPLMAPETLATRSPAPNPTAAPAPATAETASSTPGDRRPRAGAPRLASAVSASSRPGPSSPAPSGAAASSTTATAANSDASSQNEDRGFVLPPLNLSDPSLLEDHLSLGLLDPAMLLMSPPPAYTGRSSISSTRTMSTIGPNMGGGRRSERSVSPNSARSRVGVGFGGGLGLGGIGMEPIRSEEPRPVDGEGGPAVPSPRYSVPPSGSPPPPPSHARLSPPPPLTSSSEGEGGDQSDSVSVSSNASPAGSAHNAAAASSSSDDDDDDDDDASSFEVTSADPLVLAWEADRSAGIYTLDERIARDLERRRLAAAQEEEEEDDDDNCSDVPQHQAAEDGASTAAASSSGQRSGTGPASQVVSSLPAGRKSPPGQSRAGDQGAATQAKQPTTGDDDEDLALLRRRISHAEASNNSRGVVRALSVHATRSLRAQGRMARERRGRAIPPQSASEEGGSPIAAASAEPLPVPQTITEREEAESRPEPAPTVSQTPAPAPTAGRTTVPDSEDRPARSLSLRGHRMLAEAAERRMRAEKENRLRTAAAVEAQPVVVEEEEAEEQLGGASISAPTETVALTRAREEGSATSPPPPTPLRPRAAPPPPPPRSRPLSGDRSPAPAFASSSPSIAWGAAAAARPSQASLRRPTSIRRVPPPPPPNAAEILAARRASLRPVTANGIPSSTGSPSTSRTAPPLPSSEQPTPVVSAVAGESSSSPSGQPGRPSVHPHARASSVPPPPPSGSNASLLPPAVPIIQPHARSASVAPASAPTPSSPPLPPRRRPLPVPPTSLGTDRMDAFTALRQSQGFGVANSAALPSLPAPVHSTETQQQQQQQEEALSEPGPPLPRRPPRREAPAPPVEGVVSSSPSLPAHSAAGDTTMPPPPSVEDPSAQVVPSATSTSDATRASQQLPVAAGEATGPLTPPLSPGLSMYTDLDLLLARLESQENGGDGAGGTEVHTAEGGDAESAIPNGGQHYEDLLLLSDVLGQAVPSGATPAELAETLAVARVECERRRVTKSGKVKSKLSVVGVRCVDCAICLARFKVDQFAVVLPDCLHTFHEHCIRSWFRLSRVCPVCRNEVFKPRQPSTMAAAGDAGSAAAAEERNGTAAGSGGANDLLA